MCRRRLLFQLSDFGHVRSWLTLGSQFYNITRFQAVTSGEGNYTPRNGWKQWCIFLFNTNVSEPKGFMSQAPNQLIEDTAYSASLAVWTAQGMAGILGGFFVNQEMQLSWSRLYSRSSTQRYSSWRQDVVVTVAMPIVSRSRKSKLITEDWEIVISRTKDREKNLSCASQYHNFG